MMFAAVIEYLPVAAKVQSLRPAHRQYLSQLRERGQLAACGPFTDGSGALIIYEAADAAAAEQLLRDDPFHKNGVFVKYALRPWNPVMADRNLFPAT
jgi:uncharacterized protein YciI